MKRKYEYKCNNCGIVVIQDEPFKKLKIRAKATISVGKKRKVKGILGIEQEEEYRDSKVVDAFTTAMKCPVCGITHRLDIWRDKEGKKLWFPDIEDETIRIEENGKKI